MRGVVCTFSAVGVAINQPHPSPSRTVDSRWAMITTVRWTYKAVTGAWTKTPSGTKEGTSWAPMRHPTSPPLPSAHIRTSKPHEAMHQPPEALHGQCVTRCTDHQALQSGLHKVLALGVQGTGGFIKQEDAGVLQDRPSDRNALALAAWG